jgi:polysaccharide biosynthesis protein PslG
MLGSRRLSPMRRQLRDFVIVWSIVTLLLGLCTFFAIYLAYGGRPANADTFGSLALGNGTSVAIQPTTPATSIPTRQAALMVVTSTSAPAATTDGAAQVAAATNTDVPPPTPTATPLPTAETRFEVGIQAQSDRGFNWDGQRGIIRDIHDSLGMRWMKQQVRWELMEPDVKGEYRWGELDMVTAATSEYDVKIMASVVTAPNWSREAGADLSRHGPPANYQDYVDFVVAMVNRYPGKIHAIEVWNEQNLDREWTYSGGLVAADYVRLLQMTYDAVKAIDPGIIIISGALAPTGLDDGVRAVNDFNYMDQMIAAGMLNYADCIGAHHNGYNIGPSVPWNNVTNDPSAIFRGPFDNPHHSWSFYSTLQTYANKVAVAGGTQKLCVTEFGWSVAEGVENFNTPGLEFAKDNTPEEQRDFTIEALNNMREWGTVRLAFVWNLNYGPNSGWDGTNDNVPYSIIGPNWQHRPVWDALREWTTAYRAETGL